MGNCVTLEVFPGRYGWEWRWSSIMLDPGWFRESFFVQLLCLYLDATEFS